MSQERLAPQQPEDCLAQSRKSRCKGGTLIAADVWTVEEHRRRLSDPERPYRPAERPKCGGRKLHVHDHRERHPLGLVMAVLVVARFICVNPKCRPTWRVLPALLTRHLWWPWQQIEAVISAAEAVAPASGKESETETPARTDAAARQVGLAAQGVTGAKKEDKARAIERHPCNCMRGSIKTPSVDQPQSTAEDPCNIAVAVPVPSVGTLQDVAGQRDNAMPATGC